MEFGTGAMSSLIPKLSELLLREYNLKDAVKKGIGDLKDELEAMQAALVKVSSVQWDQLDPQVQIWANAVRELSYAIEDSLDSSMVRLEGIEPTKPLTFKGFIKKTRNKVSKFKIRHKIADDIKDVKIQVREVKERYERYNISNVVDNLVPTTVDPRLFVMYNKVSDLVGIDKAIDELTQSLSEGDDVSREKLETVSIVGFGGLGKTTLAKEVYDKIGKSFDCGGFVPVGRNPDRKKVLKDILLELDKQMYMDASAMDERQLINQLRQFLADKRYLFVIDDIWDIPTWDLIKCAMVDSSSRSRIVITTRICGVAEKAGGVYKMKALSDENTKRLFYSRIFGSDGSISLDNQYAEVSTKILRKCGGVPLAIITIASLLVGKQREGWSEVYDSIGFGNEENEVVENTRKILLFSYYDLPSVLKNCLLYLSIYPEDSFLRNDSLIWRWIAEGLIPSKAGTRLFELGESYLNELVNRSLVQYVEPCRIGQSPSCHVHDMVFDLIRMLSSQIKFVTVYDKEQHLTCSPINGVRRLAIHGESVEHNPSMEMGHVRSFNAMGWHNSRMPSLLSLKSLRVLFLYDCKFSHEGRGLEHLGKLVQLRYLGIMFTSIGELPMEIGHDLKYLQMLYLKGISREKLPASIGDLNKLMCLTTGKGTEPMFEIGKLTSLVELDLHSVEKCPKFFTQLGNLTEVRKLVINFDDIDERAHKDLVESLNSLPRIQQLRIRYHWRNRTHVDCWEEWKPPSMLREFELCRIVLPRRPLWLDSSCVPHLTFLLLQMEVADEQDLQILGQFPSLLCLFLHIVKMKGFGYTVGSNDFKKLRDLKANIEIITCGEGALPMLEELECNATVGRQDMVGLVPGNMPLLQRVTYMLDCQYCTIEQVNEAAQALRDMTKIHPNHPTLKIKRVGMKGSVDQLLHNLIASCENKLHDGAAGAAEVPVTDVQAQCSLITSLESLLHGHDGPCRPKKVSAGTFQEREIRKYLGACECASAEDLNCTQQALRDLILAFRSLLPDHDVDAELEEVSARDKEADNDVATSSEAGRATQP